jgi:hypothetical protein
LRDGSRKQKSLRPFQDWAQIDTRAAIPNRSGTGCFLEGKVKRNRKSHSESSKAPKRGVPRTAAQYNAKPERSRQAYDRTIQVISKMRSEKLSLRQASKDVGVNPQTVLRWGRSALKKSPSGRYTAKARDSLLRVLRLPSPEGTREIAVRDSRQAGMLGEYWAAV